MSLCHAAEVMGIITSDTWWKPILNLSAKWLRSMIILKSHYDWRTIKMLLSWAQHLEPKRGPSQPTGIVAVYRTGEGKRLCV